MNAERSLDAVFAKRAELLAKRRTAPDEEQKTESMLLFWVGALRCALPLEEIAEVLPFTACTPVPEAPPELLGAINVRGAIWPALDLAVLLGQSTDDPQDVGSVAGAKDGAGATGSTSGYLLLLKQSAALRVEGVEEVRRIAPEDWKAPGEAFSDLQIRFVKGINRENIILLDLEEVQRSEFSVHGSTMNNEQ